MTARPPLRPSYPSADAEVLRAVQLLMHYVIDNTEDLDFDDAEFTRAVTSLRLIRSRVVKLNEREARVKELGASVAETSKELSAVENSVAETSKELSAVENYAAALAAMNTKHESLGDTERSMA